MKLKSLKEMSTLTVKDLKEALNKLDESYDNLPIYLNQCDSRGNSWGTIAVGVSGFSDPDDELASFEIETCSDNGFESEKGLNPKMVFDAYLKEEMGEISDIIPILGYANLNEEDKGKVDEMVEEYNRSSVNI